ncbi:MAG: EAL domain-containing protein [Actinomycetota bacterium]|nr:EAL domain-containing protein [Actinomycetota bacterium]
MSAALSIVQAQEVAAARSTEVELFSVAGRDGFLREVNASFAGLLGLTPDEVNGRSLLELVHPADLSHVVAGLAALDGGAAEILLENRFVQRDGHWVHLQWVARPLAGTDLWWATGRDTTEFHRLLNQRLDLRTQLDLALGPASAAMWELNIVEQRVSWEPQAAELFGVSIDELPSSPEQLAAVVVAEDAPAIRSALIQLAATGVADASVRVGLPSESRHLSLRGKVLDRDRRGHPIRAVGLIVDITREKAMEEQMLRMVMSDALTGVPNRRAFDQALRSGLRRAARARQPISAVMIDIDNFKKFNDAFGHLVGDETLCSVARALKTSIHREGHLLARFGGEEFALVLPDTDGAGAALIAEHLLQAVRMITMRQAPDTPVTVSVGTATWLPENPPLRPADLLARADEALYAAKDAGKNRTVAYEHFLASRADLEAAIAQGLHEGEFQLYYQPTISLNTGDITGFEALARWNRPGHGLIAPDMFIPAAEASATDTLINLLGRWALREATCQLASWSASGVTGDRKLRMAVNASGRHISSPAIIADVEAALAASALDPTQLELELTETILADEALAGTHLAAVRALGITVAIDDFGTGHTSIGQLPNLPVNTLKIDRSFVAATDPRQRALVRLIIEAAHAFNLHVVAEGVEDATTLNTLTELGCDTAQGYLIARPMAANDIAAWLADWTPLRTLLDATPAGA